MYSVFEFTTSISSLPKPGVIGRVDLLESSHSSSTCLPSTHRLSRLGFRYFKKPVLHPHFRQNAQFIFQVGRAQGGQESPHDLESTGRYSFCPFPQLAFCATTCLKFFWVGWLSCCSLQKSSLHQSHQIGDVMF